MLTLMVSCFLVPMVGLAVDGGRGYLVKVKLSTAVDGASLAAGRLMGTPSGASIATQTNYTVTTAQEYLAANFPNGFFGSQLAGNGTICVDPGTDNSDPCQVGNGGQLQTYKMRTVSVKAQVTMPTFFMRLLNMPTVTVGAAGVAQRRDVRVVLVVDRSSSMSKFYGAGGNCATPPCIQAMLNNFVNSFSGAGELGGRDEVGIVVFGGSGIVAYPARDVTKDYTDYTQFTPPDNNFKTRSSTIINEITSQSNTGTSEALYLAYMTLRADAATNTDLATKLNVIVLFTDGLANGITTFANDPSQIANHSGTTHFMIPSASCTFSGGSWSATNVATANSNLIGWFAQWNGFANSNNNAHGFFKSMMAYSQSGNTGNTDIDNWMKNGEGTSPQWTSDSCPSTTMPSGTLTQFPDYDLFGNYTTLDNAPAVSSLTPPKAPGNKSLYTLGSLYQNQCSYSTYNSTATSNACQIGLASWQAAVHQGWKIWNQVIWSKTSQTNVADPGPNLSAPVVFTLGFDNSKIGGNEAPDLNMLQLIANDPNSPVSFSSRVNGHAYIASDVSSVGLAFQQIKSEILRLAQ